MILLLKIILIKFQKRWDNYLNTAFSSEGSYIHIPKNIQVDKPIQIIHFSTGKMNLLCSSQET